MLPTRILLVDDHSIVCDALALLLERQPNLKIVGSATSGEQAIPAAMRLKPDLIIMDLVLPKLSGLEATKQILVQNPQIQIIALSACHEPIQVSRALHAGVRGYVLKSAPATELLLAIAAIAAGKMYVSPAFSDLLVDGQLRAATRESTFDRLSAREHQVLKCVIGGSTSSEIGGQLSLSRKTVETYRSRIMLKLGVASRSELIQAAMQHELPLA
jgi:two-component system, NarL family, response regulator NreC